MSKIVQKPFTPIGWCVLKELTRPDGRRMHFKGEVVRHDDQGGLFNWLVVFSNGEEEFMQCEELAESISFSYA